MKKISIIVLIVSLLSCKQEESNKTVVESSEVSNTSLTRVEPPNWWVGMVDKSLQLLVNEEGIGNSTPEISYAGITIENVHKAKSPNYLFIDLSIAATTRAGKFDIVFNFEDGIKKTHTYELKDRLKDAGDYLGFNSSDAIYLITPDRFANGNSNNDTDSKLLETSINREDDYARHGGDLQGITEHLDYIDNMGFTAVWPTPVLINDMPAQSYHGYAITDYYQVDPRFGTLEDYKTLSNELKERGMKLIMDQVVNHCGLEHWWIKDLPFSDWVNNQKNYEDNIDNWNWETNINSNHKRTTNQDLYASKIDRDGMNQGWFVSSMPDLNQRNPFMATYLIQNSIWWIETLDLGGVRQDTYPYPDKSFMSDWAGAIMKEYPNFTIVGEEWSYNPLLVAYWQDGHPNKDGYESHLKSSMDFPMQKAIVDGLNEDETWGTGLVKIYEGLANDFAYTTPEDIMVFLDNHDKSRVYTELHEDEVKTKMALGYMLSLPRIPQIYYGTEILMDDTAKPGDHGLIRTDFPGGWQSDTINAFTGVGLTEEQKDMQDFLKSILNYRKTSNAIQKGKTMHFAPFMGTYFLFRVVDGETFVVILNKNENPITLDLKHYAEMGLHGKTLKNVITNETFVWNESIDLKERGIILLTTK